MSACVFIFTQMFLIDSVMHYVFLEDHIGIFAVARHIGRRNQIDV